MARRIKDKDLDSRDARAKLKARGKPYWAKPIGKGLHLGYRKNKVGGTWVVRCYIGEQKYKTETIGQTDDLEDANGTDVLSFGRRKRRLASPVPARASSAPIPSKMPSTTISNVPNGASHYDVEVRLHAFALAALGNRPVAELKADEIRTWHRELSKMPPKSRTKIGAKQQGYLACDLNDPETARKRQISANRCFGQLKAALNHAWREGKVTNNSEWARVEKFKEVDVARVRYLTVAECKRLINASQGDLRTLVQSALQTGARYRKPPAYWSPISMRCRHIAHPHEQDGQGQQDRPDRRRPRVLPPARRRPRRGRFPPRKGMAEVQSDRAAKRSLQARRHHPGDRHPCVASYLGEPFGDGRDGAHGRRQRPWSY